MRITEACILQYRYCKGTLGVNPHFFPSLFESKYQKNLRSFIDCRWSLMGL